MEIRPLKLAGTFEIQLKPIGDARGYFMRTYDKASLERLGLVTDWLQENQSLSAHPGIIRGLHFQYPPHAETKLVRVIRGAALDVFVDLRKSSATYGQWDCIELSADNHRAVYIPKGFAHGFCTLTENVLVTYKVDAYYAPTAEGGLPWNDPDLAIRWPVTKAIVSPKDGNWKPFRDFVSPFP
jgi:dTDP-4-dehydrorhamnose 3,5-epimerase